MSDQVTHYPTCSANYPEKPAGEPARKLVDLDIGDGETVRQCVDCGAFVIIKKEQ